MPEPMVWMKIDMPDLGYLADQVGKMNFAKPFKQTCEEIKANAWKRIRARQRAVGGRYRNLNAKTIAQKRKLGVPEPETPLLRTTKMMLDFRFWGKGNRWTIGFRTAESAQKAIIHIQEGAGRGRVTRPFLRPDFALTTREMKAHIARVRRFVRKRLEQITGTANKRRRRLK